MADVIYTAPTSEPITLDEAKEHMLVEITEDDVLISSLIKAARVYCELYQNRAIITQTRELWLDSFPAGTYIEIPMAPLASVTHIKYYGTDHTEYTVTNTDYFVDSKSFVGRVGLAYGKSWPNSTLRPFNGVVIRYVCGAAAANEEVKQALKLLVAHWYENREAVGAIQNKQLEFTVHALLGLNRKCPI